MCCGIAGSFHPDHDNDDPWVAEALDRIAHRGPDGRGIQTWTAATHGHVRLAIQDPEPRSDQPFIYKGVILSFVGEIWNWRQLRRGLEADLGYEFQTEGDTELLAAWMHYSISTAQDPAHALEFLEGQFAFAVTESLTGRTWVVRDRFGKIPLYLIRDEEETLFAAPGAKWASERKAFGERAIHADAVPPGSVTELGTGETRFWYEVPNRIERGKGDPAITRELLERAVETRLQADVPVTCLISGGVDSSSILALAQRHYPEVVAYTAVLDPDPVPSRRPTDGSDVEAARFVCKELGVELREVRIPPPSDETIREAIACIEITMKAQIEIAMLCRPLAKRIREDGFKVVLTGEGADELFGGYGNLARHASSDIPWMTARRNGILKMGRGNLVRINKVFMAEGVEARTPFMDRALVEHVLTLPLKDCPQQKMALREAVRGLVPEETRMRHKLAFQVGTGMREAVEDFTAGSQQITYNNIARELFGGLPRG